MVSNFKTNLPSNYVAQIESFPWKTVFKFGDGRNVKSKEIIFPVLTGDKNCKIKVEIRKENIQLSLSKSSLKKTQTVIDLDRDKATILGKKINLHHVWSLIYVSGTAHSAHGVTVIVRDTIIL